MPTIRCFCYASNTLPKKKKKQITDRYASLPQQQYWKEILVILYSEITCLLEYNPCKGCKNPCIVLTLGDCRRGLEHNMD